jgi:hypothetical protein
MEDRDEVIFSVIMAVREANRVPIFLLCENSEILLKTWKEHEGKPIVIGRNVYDNLLRSVVIGIAEFPLPKEVIDSLPQNYLVSAGAEEVIRPLLVLSEYNPSEVQYIPDTKGVFIVFNPKTKTTLKTFAGIPMLDFPIDLSHVSFIRFELAKCWNQGNEAVKTWVSLANDIISKIGEDKRNDVEEHIQQLLSSRERMSLFERDPNMDYEEIARRISQNIASTFDVDVVIPSEAAKTLADARVIDDYLWKWGSFD